MKKTFTKVGTGIYFALTVAAISMMGNVPVMATNLFWSANGSSQGGAGTWNTTTANRFGTAAGGPFNLTWTNAGQTPPTIDSAEFGGTAGQVNISNGLVVNVITTDVTGYTIGNGNTATNNAMIFSGANSGITTPAAGTLTTIQTAFSGTLTKAGGGRLELGNGFNPNANSMKYVITAGDITSASIARLSATAPTALVPDFLTFNGGGWAINTGNQDTGANRGITIKSGGAFLGSANGTIVLTISSPIVGTEGGGLTLTNAGPFTGNTSSTSGGFVTLSNTANSWNGPTTVTSGLLKLGAAGVIPNTSNVTLNGGDFDLNGFSETVGIVLLNNTNSAISGAGTLTGSSYDLRNGTSSSILGGAGIVATKTTTNTVTLSGASTFTGGFNLNAGKVRVGNNAALGAANSAVAIANSTTLSANSTTARTLTYAYTINGNFTLGDLTDTGAITMAGTMNLGSATRTITVASVPDTILNTISASISGSGGIIKAGAGILVLSGATSSYDGATTITTGKLQANSANALGSAVGNTQVVSSTELLFDGTTFTTPEPIQIEGSGAGDGGAISVQNSAKITLSGPVTLTSDATLSTSNLASATYSNASAITGTASLSLQGGGGTPDLFHTIANGTISGAISLGAGSVTKNETGTWTLSNATGNSYDGGTTINDGTLLANNTTGSATGSGAVSVNGTGTLGGTGNTDATNGAVTVNFGAHIKAGAGAASGTLTVPTLNLQSGGLLTATLGAPTNAAKVAVTNTDGAAIDGSLQISTVNGFDDGTYRVLTYNGTRGGIGLQQSDQLGNGFDSIAILDSGTSGFVDVTVAITKRQWNVNNDGSWVDSGNWTGGIGGAPTGPGSVANFLSAINTDRVVTIDDAPKTVGIVNFNNANKYTIAGTDLVIDTWGADGQINVVNGSHEISAPLTLAKNTNINVASGKNLLLSGTVSGAGGIIHSGSGTTTLTGTNTYAGGNIVSAGTLVGSSASIIGAITDNGAVVFNQTSDGTFASVISGAGSVTKNDGGVLALTAANPFTGGFNLNGGTVAVNSTTALGAANMPVNIAGGTTISTTTTTARTLTNAFAVNGNFSLGQATGGTAAVTMAGTINLGGATRTITLVNAADTISGVISNGGLNVDAGTGVLSITGAANTYSGTTTLSTGTTAINATSILGDGTGAINMVGGSLRVTATRTVAVANPIVMTADTLVETNSTATTVDVNFSSNSITASAGTLTFKNNGADGTGDTFQPRFGGTNFNFGQPIVIDNGTTGKTKLLSINTTTGTVQTFSGVISGNGSYLRSATAAATGGTTIFTAGNTYSGGTAVTDGLLLVNNTGSSESGTGTGAVTVGAGTAATAFRGTLGGTGYVGGAITVQEGGTIAPGADSSLGTLTAAGNVTFALNGHLAIQLSGASADKLVVGGNIILSAAEFLDVTGTGTGTSWLIGTYGGTATGTFDTVTPGYAVTIGSGLITLNSVVVSLLGDFNSDGKVDAGDYATWRKNDGPNNPLANDNGAGNQAARFTLWRANFGKPPGAGSGGGLGGSSPVPEPGTLGLVSAGLAALAFCRRGRR